jgi:hypothetical protein
MVVWENSSVFRLPLVHRTAKSSSASALAAALAAVVAILGTVAAHAAGVPGVLDEVIVSASRVGGLAGSVTSASVGTVLAEQLETRPLQRVGEVLEVVPGLIVTQHSGGGKANQFFLRGFNLDHGTDLATRVEGLPVNLPTHAHGQGYSDINFMIPELVKQIEYRKGTYYAEYGNFSAAGAIDVSYRRQLEHDLALVTGGQYGYARAFAGVSRTVAGGDLLVAADTTRSAGPWELPEGLAKVNGVIKFTQGDADQGYQLLVMGYRGQWRSTDQIPRRAVTSGAIGRFGHYDPTDGGETHRYSLSAGWWQPLGAGSLRVNGYAMDYGLDLYSNFTYATDRVNGDQFEQLDNRRVQGLDLDYGQPLGAGGSLRAGLQWRRDDIPTVGLYRTRAKVRHDTVREDSVVQQSLSGWLSHSITWTDWLRTEAGVRLDAFRFQVASNVAANSGLMNDQIASPKLAVVLSPWQQTELFLDWGTGFHSNDARGTTQRVDPLDGATPVAPVTPLVKATGAEIGLRTAVIPNFQFATSLWTLRLASELLFIGDGGITESTRPSARDGVELSAIWTPSDLLIVDADLAWTRSRFSDQNPVGDRVPNAVERVASVGLSYKHPAGWYLGARLRHLGPAALVEDNSVRADASTIINFDFGYQVTRETTVSLALLNAFDAQADDITYFYESQLPGESAPVADVHFHPVEPRQVRVSLQTRF